MRVGHNKGKKYKKLQGFEQATPDSQARADAFMRWYGDNFNHIKNRLIFPPLYDDDIATGTALAIYDCIALKGLVPTDNRSYYLRAYHTNRIAALKKAPHFDELTKNVDARLTEETGNYYDDLFAASEVMLQYVRDNYTPFESSLFEIYIGLQPDISYQKLSTLLDVPFTKVWTKLGAIRKDLHTRFRNEVAGMLSV